MEQGGEIVIRARGTLELVTAGRGSLQARPAKLMVNGRALVFRLALLALAASTANGVVFALMRRSTFLALFPGATGVVFALFLATSIVGLASLVGLWLWQAWAHWLFGIVGVVVVALDFVARGPELHMLAAVGSTLIVLALSHAVRERFRA